MGSKNQDMNFPFAKRYNNKLINLKTQELISNLFANNNASITFIDNQIVSDNNLRMKEDIDLSKFKTSKFSPVVLISDNAYLTEIENQVTNSIKENLDLVTQNSFKEKTLKNLEKKTIFEVSEILSVISTNNSSKKEKITLKRLDCIRKRVKVCFNNFLLSYLNNQIKSEGFNYALSKLHQNFVADVKIQSNKIYFGMKLKEIYSLKFDENKNNFNIINKIFETNNFKLISLFNQTYREMYDLYISSDSHKKNIEKFKLKESQEYSFNFKQISEEMANYYLNSIPYNCICKKSRESLNLLEFFTS